MNSDHYLVPPHKILSPSEADEVLKKFGVSAANIPKIFADDPQAKRLGAKIGQIIEITRSKSVKYYRLVVPRQ
ncbi:MAG: DNA-directed RNA polymerase subunit RpoH/Rpb5 C-terminal domain-containing protein [Candidatus Micrarchaeaceae archaeon]